MKETVDALGGKVASEEIKEIFELQKAVKEVVNYNENIENRLKNLENKNARKDEVGEGSKPQSDAEQCIVKGNRNYNKRQKIRRIVTRKGLMRKSRG